MTFKIEALSLRMKKNFSNTTIFDGVIPIWSYAKIWYKITYAIILLTSVFCKTVFVIKIFLFKLASFHS